MKPTRGASLILTSAFFYATYGIWSRIMGNAFGEFSQAWTRGLVLLIFILIFNFKYKIFKPLQKRDLPWLAIIGLAGGINQAPYYFGFQHLSIGTATLLFYAALVVGGYLLGKIFFKEQITGIKIVSLVLAIVGMASIYHFQLLPSQFLAAGMTIISGLLGSITVIIPRKLVGNYPEFQVMVSYFSLQIIFNGVLSILFHNSIPHISNITPWIGQLAYAIAMLFANWAAIEGYKHYDASIGSLIGLAEIIFGVAFGVIIFHEPLTIGITLGSLIIISAAALPHLKLG
ncbi:DMT family transporter [Candidatus Shapirobacteria bacterium]|nr:DMT family transporter [Candidatus Shapirobacteria bacterium]